MPRPPLHGRSLKGWSQPSESAFKVCDFFMLYYYPKIDYNIVLKPLGEIWGLTLRQCDKFTQTERSPNLFFKYFYFSFGPH